jgi:hypothetical protein
MADMKIYERREWAVHVRRQAGDDWPDVQEDYGGFLVRPDGLRFTVRLDVKGELERAPLGVEVEGFRILKDGREGRRIGQCHYLPRGTEFHKPYVEQAIAEIAGGL